jgi:alpha-beta hydrolase superfamily lysophospholipase
MASESTTSEPRIGCASIDRPEVLTALFHPRPEGGESQSAENREDLLIPVGEGILVGARLHGTERSAPVILFFHGNGEIVADYDDLAPMYMNAGINFLPVDYRGYGRSTGIPSVTDMMSDCHMVFRYVCQFLENKAYTGPLLVMGRSLGSASALEIASRHKERINGLIIESGFAYTVPLLERLGIDTDAYGIVEEGTFRNLEKMAKMDKPLLVIHAEYDHIIPFGDGEALYEACPATHKTLLQIKEADHNTILAYGLNDYLRAVVDFIDAMAAGG